MQIMDERTRIQCMIADELEAMHAACKPLIEEAVLLQSISLPKVTLSGSFLDIEREPLPEGFQELIAFTQAPFLERINGLHQRLKQTDKP